MLQFPFSVHFLPEMIRPPAIDDLPEVLLCDRTVVKEFLEMLSRKFTVIFLYQFNPFFPCQMAVADLMGRVGRGPSDTELYECQIIVEPVQSVVEGSVFRIGPFVPVWQRLEPGVLDTIVIVLLRDPFFIIAEEMDLRAYRFKPFDREVSCKALAHSFQSRKWTMSSGAMAGEIVLLWSVR